MLFCGQDIAGGLRIFDVEVRSAVSGHPKTACLDIEASFTCGFAIEGVQFQSLDIWLYFDVIANDSQGFCTCISYIFMSHVGEAFFSTMGMVNSEKTLRVCSLALSAKNLMKFRFGEVEGVSLGAETASQLDTPFSETSGTVYI